MQFKLEDALDTVTDVINKVPSLNDFITTMRRQVNPLAKFVHARLRYEPGSKVVLGSKILNTLDRDYSETLYGAYQAFNRANGDESLKPYSFLEQFINQMKALGYKDVSSKKTNIGLVVMNVKLKKEDFDDPDHSGDNGDGSLPSQGDVANDQNTVAQSPVNVTSTSIKEEKSSNFNDLPPKKPLLKRLKF
eukprot:c16124_g1_i5.p1 GENE.c16124_g1_i5~~c16124_g1_i5.p1  ORF type:complete len:191 (-),score=-45.71 c16124_g1_i5:315-887(-)